MLLGRREQRSNLGTLTNSQYNTVDIKQSALASGDPK